MQLFQAGSETQFPGLSWGDGFLTVWILLIESCAFAGGLVLAYEYFRHERRLKHPGHWLIAMAATTYLAQRAVYMTTALYASYGMSQLAFEINAWGMTVIFSIETLAWAVITYFVARHYGKLWFLTFGLIATSSLLAQLPLDLFSLSSCCVLLATLAAVWQDYQTKRRPRLAAQVWRNVLQYQFVVLDFLVAVTHGWVWALRLV